MRVALLVLPAIFLMSCAGAGDVAGPPIEFNGRTLTISEAVSFGNLSLVFLLGPDTDSGDWSTVEGLSRSAGGRIKEVGGGGTVSLLEVSNADRQPVYLQAGEPLRGGQQDRVIACDTVVPPGSQGRVSVYCIEQSRWHGANDFGKGGSVQFIAPTRALKYVIQHKLRSQQAAVWEEVRRMKGKAVGALNLVKSSTSSLNEELAGALTHERFSGLAASVLSAPVPAGAIGAVFSINGEMTHFDLYATSALFSKQYRKLVHSAVLEALLESGGARRNGDPAALRAWMAWALSALDPVRVRIAYEGGLPQFEETSGEGERSLFAYINGTKWLHVQGIRYARLVQGIPQSDSVSPRVPGRDH